MPFVEEIEYQRCLAGERACPPEGCGGVGDYYRLLEILDDPDHSEYNSIAKWVGGEYDPECFNRKEVEFTDPDRRLQR